MLTIRLICDSMIYDQDLGIISKDVCNIVYLQIPLFVCLTLSVCLCVFGQDVSTVMNK